MLERMKEKVESEETLALAYGDLSKMETNIEEEIDKTLLTDSTETRSSQSEELAVLKAKMGIQ